MGNRFKGMRGFSLIETIVSAAMMLLLISGLLLALDLTETRGRGFDEFTRTQEELETAFEITLRTLRSQAHSGTLTVINDGQGITFSGMDGLNWTFTKTNSDYLLIHNGSSEVLMNGNCQEIQFQSGGSEVELTLSAVAPQDWTGDTNDLEIHGHITIRNH